MIVSERDRKGLLVKIQTVAFEVLAEEHLHEAVFQVACGWGKGEWVWGGNVGQLEIGQL